MGVRWKLGILKLLCFGRLSCCLQVPKVMMNETLALALFRLNLVLCGGPLQPRSSHVGIDSREFYCEASWLDGQTLWREAFESTLDAYLERLTIVDRVAQPVGARQISLVTSMTLDRQ